MTWIRELSRRLCFRLARRRWRQRARALGVWISFWRGLTWRQRYILWICSSALEDD